MAERKAKWQNDYIARTYDRVNLTLPKGDKERIESHAAGTGESVNAFIRRAINEAMQRTVSEYEQLPTDTLEAARSAAEQSGETVAAFISRAINTQAQRDKLTSKLGQR